MVEDPLQACSVQLVPITNTQILDDKDAPVLRIRGEKIGPVFYDCVEEEYGPHTMMCGKLKYAARFQSAAATEETKKEHDLANVFEAVSYVEVAKDYYK